MLPRPPPDRPPGKTAERKAAEARNSRRYRVRYNRGQKIYRAVANTVRLTSFLTREGYLIADREVYDHRMIEMALTLYIDDVGQKIKRH